MRRLAVCAVLLLVSGCGADADPLVGTWTADISASCADGFRFDQRGTFTRLTICTLDSGATGLERHDGTFDADGKTIQFVIGQSTCPDMPKTGSVGYSVSPASLVLTFSASIEVLSRVTAAGPGDTGAAALGCFSDGVFTPHPLALL